mmetsp:Transcript_3883/g.6775  ORF Transcript_3883/g.6775 Transcript_3883/m.6775 type:complete len:333 (-) Transcript_3883:680-1678(-)
MKHKMKSNPDDQALKQGERVLTLREVFEKLNLTSHELSVDTLDVHADTSTFFRFDRFNLKYNPFGQSELREIFMKSDNFMEGKYLAEITHQVMDDLNETKYQNAEYRISIYGRHSEEWFRLAKWFLNNRIYSDNVRWLIQVPRLFSVYRKLGILQNFQQMLDHLFTPLFDATIHPEQHPEIHALLQQIVGFDSVDDESVPQPKMEYAQFGSPEEWTSEDNPPYAYYSFYIYVNLYTLNQLREERGMNTFTYRPHAGEAGDPEHLAVTYLLAHGINHGLNLRKMPVLQYLYYLSNIGIAMSPLSNNALFVEYTKVRIPHHLLFDLVVLIAFKI